MARFTRLGIKLTGIWSISDMDWVYMAISDIMSSTGWDDAAFRAAIGTDPDAGNFMTINMTGQAREGLVGSYNPNSGTLDLYNLVHQGGAFARRWLVHEFAHRIDFAAKGGGEGACKGTGWWSCSMAANVGSTWETRYYNSRFQQVGEGDPGAYYPDAVCVSNCGTAASGWKNQNIQVQDLAEDWAEAFTAMVYSNSGLPGNSQYQVANASTRYQLMPNGRLRMDANRQRYVQMVADYFKYHMYNR